MKRIVFFSIIFSALLLTTQHKPAVADIAVEISGNGADTQNTVSQNQNTTTTIQQVNSAETKNQVQQTADTGKNQVSNNTGESVDVKTGDVSSQTTITNKLNSTQLTVDPCCGGQQKAIVSGNGAGSQNDLSIQNTSAVTAIINQNAVVNTVVNATANTGNNTTNNNSGSVTITTGTINAKQQISTIANEETAKLTAEGQTGAVVKIAGNGAGSQNIVQLNLFGSLLLVKNNTALITNTVYTNFDTGNNVADNNLEDVLINTGSIISSTTVQNGPINSGVADVICCDDGTPTNPGNGGGPGTNPETPKNIPPTPTQANSNSNSSSSNASSGNGNPGTGGAILGALTDLLPATGASAFHFWMWSVVYLLMFLSGLYVRLRAGRSPNYRFA